MAGEFKIYIMAPDSILMIDSDGGEPIASYADTHDAVDEVVAQFRKWLVAEVQAQRTRREAQRAAWKAEQEALARRARFAVIAEART